MTIVVQKVSSSKEAVEVDLRCRLSQLRAIAKRACMKSRSVSWARKDQFEGNELQIIAGGFKEVCRGVGTILPC